MREREEEEEEKKKRKKERREKIYIAIKSFLGSYHTGPLSHHQKHA